MVERDIVLPGSQVRWRLQVTQSSDMFDAQIEALRKTLVRSFLLLAASSLTCCAFAFVAIQSLLQRTTRARLLLTGGTNTAPDLFIPGPRRLLFSRHRL